MVEKNSYYLEIKTLSLGLHSFEYQLNDDFFENTDFDCKIYGNILAKVEVNRQNSIIEIRLLLKGEVFVPCDICLEDMPLQVNTDSSMYLKLDNNCNLLNNDELEIDYYDGIINFHPVFKEEILLSIPIKKVHKQGQCDKSMLEIFNRYTKNREHKKNSNFEIDPRWAALKNISDN